MKRTHTIGFDATKANDNITGRGNYSCFVIEALSKACSENTYFRMYTPKRQPNQSYDALDRLPNVESMEPDGSLWRKFSGLWRIWRLSHDAQRGDVELYHGLDNRLPLGLGKRDIRSVVTVHDMHFVSHPTSILPFKRLFNLIAMRSTCRRADRIIAVSESTKRDIIKYLDIDGEKIDVIYPGYNPIYGAPISEERVAEVRAKYELPEKYILNVGAQHERRNISAIIDAMDKLDYEIHLVAVGRRTSYTNRIRRQARSAAIEKRLHLLHNVDNEELAAAVGDDIYAFPFSYRGGLSQDEGYLQKSGETLFLFTGEKVDFEMIGVEEEGVLDDQDAAPAEEDEELDFSMM
jgi:glycosyltransferase involved in cell wall biosynthesis